LASYDDDGDNVGSFTSTINDQKEHCYINNNNNVNNNNNSNSNNKFSVKFAIRFSLCNNKGCVE